VSFIQLYGRDTHEYNGFRLNKASDYSSVAGLFNFLGKIKARPEEILPGVAACRVDTIKAVFTADELN